LTQRSITGPENKSKYLRVLLIIGYWSNMNVH